MIIGLSTPPATEVVGPLPIVDGEIVELLVVPSQRTVDFQGRGCGGAVAGDRGGLTPDLDPVLPQRAAGGASVKHQAFGDGGRKTQTGDRQAIRTGGAAPIK